MDMVQTVAGMRPTMENMADRVKNDERVKDSGKDRALEGEVHVFEGHVIYLIFPRAVFS